MTQRESLDDIKFRQQLQRDNFPRRSEMFEYMERQRRNAKTHAAVVAYYDLLVAQRDEIGGPPVLYTPEGIAYYQQVNDWVNEMERVVALYQR